MRTDAEGNMIACEFCVYFDATQKTVKEQGAPTCRRFPSNIYPKAYEWCGEFVRLEEWQVAGDGERKDLDQ